ncbi:MAG: hypothetical protein V7642_671 [Burkholderiales bacterium]|jgi:hypothetical protein
MTIVKHDDSEKLARRGNGRDVERRFAGKPVDATDLQAWELALARFQVDGGGTGPDMHENVKTVIAEYEQRAKELEAIRHAKGKYAKQEQITNIQTANDNFIRDNVTGK